MALILFVIKALHRWLCSLWLIPFSLCFYLPLYIFQYTRSSLWKGGQVEAGQTIKKYIYQRKQIIQQVKHLDQLQLGPLSLLFVSVRVRNGVNKLLGKGFYSPCKW